MAGGEKGETAREGIFGSSSCLQLSLMPLSLASFVKY